MFDDDVSVSDTPAIDFRLTEIEEFTDEEKLNFEKEFLGIYLTSHPHLDQLAYLYSFGTTPLEEIEEQPEGTRIKIGGLLDNVKRIFTKKTGSEMAFLSVMDEKGTALEVVVFPKTFEMCKNILIKDTVVIIDGKIDTKNDKPTILADSITPINSLLLDLPVKTN